MRTARPIALLVALPRFALWKPAPTTRPSVVANNALLVDAEKLLTKLARRSIFSLKLLTSFAQFFWVKMSLLLSLGLAALAALIGSETIAVWAFPRLVDHSQKIALAIKINSRLPSLASYVEH